MSTLLHRPKAWATGMRRCLAAAAAVLGLPGAASGAHFDGFVFEFTQPVQSAAFHAFCRHALPCHPTSPPLTTIASTSWSGNYLGTFGEETLSFQALDYLDIMALYRDRAYLSFDLILTGYWPGTNDPDFETFFKVVGNGKTLFDGSVDDTGGFSRHFDLIFDFSPINPNCCTDIALALSASFGPGYEDWDFPGFEPRWGIDNFVVSSTPIPEPATGALVGLGLLLLAARRRRPDSRL